MNTWQPIETAPKDGTEILIGQSYKDVWYSCVVEWNSNEWRLTETGSYAEDAVPDIDPTHWCQIPEPPTP